MASRRESVIEELLDRYGETYAKQAGIRLADKPSPLYQLLVLATLLSARISADVAVAAARELFAAGYRTPHRMRKASWQDRVDALGRDHYRRYDERTATMLGEAADCSVTGGVVTCANCATRPGAIRSGSASCSRSSRASDQQGRTSSSARCRRCGRMSRRT